MLNRHSKFPQAHFLKSVLISNFKRLNFPFKFSYAVTYRCNLKCKMCNIWKKSPDQEELNLNQIEDFFKKANKFSWVGITGGEPFLRNDLPEIADLAAKYCNRLSAIHFATNGQLTDKVIDFTRNLLKNHKHIKVVYTVSIDGPPKIHDEIRGIEGTWKRAVNTFIKLNEIKNVKAQIGFTFSSHNLDHFDEAFQSLKEVYPKLKFDDININVFQKSNFYYENMEMQPPNQEQLVKEIKRILTIDKDSLSVNNFLRRKYLQFYLKYLETKKCPLKCQALSSTCYMDPYGNLFPCAVYNKKLINIKELKDDFEKVWNSEEAKRLSTECSHHICPSCWSPCDAFSAIAGSLGKACFSTLPS